MFVPLSSALTLSLASAESDTVAAGVEQFMGRMDVSLAAINVGFVSSGF